MGEPNESFWNCRLLPSEGWEKVARPDEGTLADKEKALIRLSGIFSHAKWHGRRR